MAKYRIRLWKGEVNILQQKYLVDDINELDLFSDYDGCSVSSSGRSEEDCIAVIPIQKSKDKEENQQES